MTSGNKPFEDDELVSATYRELQAEQAPEHLNQRILRMARGEASTARRSPFPNWMKPAAWAATVGLSLAIVLELSEVPSTPQPMYELPATALDDRPEAVTLEAADAPDNSVGSSAPQQDLEGENANQLEVLIRQPKGEPETNAAPAQGVFPAQQTDSTAARKQAIETAADAMQNQRIDASSERRQRQRLEIAPADAYERSASSDVATDKRAAAPVRSQQALAIAEAQEDADDAGTCSAAARSEQEDWLSCIEALRASGKEEAADREYEAFLKSYGPDRSGSPDYRE